MSTLRTINVIHPSGSTTNIVNDSSGNVTVGGGITSGSALDMGSSFKRNRILNGNMLIDQRNAGASVTQTTSVLYTLDRWSCYGSVASKFTVQQNAGSVTPPAGYTKYLGATSSSAYTVGASEFFFIQQVIEGYNVADLGWGAAGAQSVTLSFWVRSSLTGTFGGTLSNDATNRVYPFTYTISSANTWTAISVTVAGDTSGTWQTGTSGGLVVNFNMGAGATVSGTAGAWSGSTLRAPTGATSVVGTSGATFYITGVQLEVGTKATPYEMQIYSDQLAQCQRYYSKSYNIDVAPGTVTYVGSLATFSPTASANRPVIPIFFPVSMRTTPTLIAYSPNNGATGNFYNNDATANFAVQTSVNTGSSGASWLPSGTMTANAFFTGHWVASAEL